MKRYTCQNKRFPTEKINVPANSAGERSPISMADFFALAEVKAFQLIQSRNPYNSVSHRAASEGMRALADKYCDDKGESCAAYFGEY